MATGLWMDKFYAACTLQGARCKQQCFRRNLEEVALWPLPSVTTFILHENGSGSLTKIARKCIPQRQRPNALRRFVFSLLCPRHGGQCAWALPS